VAAGLTVVRWHLSAAASQCCSKALDWPSPKRPPIAQSSLIVFGSVSVLEYLSKPLKIIVWNPHIYWLFKPIMCGAFRGYLVQ